MAGAVLVPWTAVGVLQRYRESMKQGFSTTSKRLAEESLKVPEQQQQAYLLITTVLGEGPATTGGLAGVG